MFSLISCLCSNSAADLFISSFSGWDGFSISNDKNLIPYLPHVYFILLKSLGTANCYLLADGAPKAAWLARGPTCWAPRSNKASQPSYWVASHSPSLQSCVPLKWRGGDAEEDYPDCSSSICGGSGHDRHPCLHACSAPRRTAPYTRCKSRLAMSLRKVCSSQLPHHQQQRVIILDLLTLKNQAADMLKRPTNGASTTVPVCLLLSKIPLYLVSEA